MAIISIPEFVIYAIIGYGTFLFAFLKMPKLDSIHIAFFVPGIVALILLTLWAFNPSDENLGGGNFYSITQINETESYTNGTNKTVTGDHKTTFDIQSRMFAYFNLLLVLLLVLYLIYSGVRLLLSTGYDTAKK